MQSLQIMSRTILAFLMPINCWQRSVSQLGLSVSDGTIKHLS